MTESAEKLYTVPEAIQSEDSPFCKRVSAKTLYTLVKEDKVPGVVRIGNRIFLTRAGMREFIAKGGAQCAQKPKPALKTAAAGLKP